MAASRYATPTSNRDYCAASNEVSKDLCRSAEKTVIVNRGKQEKCQKEETEGGARVIVSLPENKVNSMAGKFLINGKIVEVVDFKSRVNKRITARKHRNMIVVDISGQGINRKYTFNGQNEANKYTIEMETGGAEDKVALLSNELRFENLFEISRKMWSNLNSLCEICEFNKVQYQRTIFELLSKAQVTKNSRLYSIFNFFRDKGSIKDSPRLTLSYLISALYSKEESSAFDTLKSMIDGFVSGREMSVLPDNLMMYIKRFQLTLILKTEIAIDMLRFQPAVESFVLNKKPKNASKAYNRFEEKLNFISLPKQREFHFISRQFRSKISDMDRPHMNLSLRKDGDILNLLQTVENRTGRKIAVSPDTRHLHSYSTSLMAKISDTVNDKNAVNRARMISLVNYDVDSVK